MHLEIPHALQPRDAIDRLDRYLDQLLARPLPAGIQIRDVSRQWSEHRLDVSFKAKKGLLGVSLSGVLEVRDDRVSIDVELPGLVTAFMDEERIREGVRRELGGVLGSTSDA